MQVIKSIDFSIKEKESLNIMLHIWEDYYGRCRSEDESLCDNCVLVGFCRNTNDLLSNGVDAIKENLVYRI